VTVEVILKEFGTLDSEFIAGNGLIYGVDEMSANAFTADLLKLRAQVIAYDNDGVAINRDDLVVNADDLANVQAALTAKRVGDYTVRIKTPELAGRVLTRDAQGSTETTIVVTLTDHGVAPTVDPHDGTKITSGNIGANDFIIGLNESGELSEANARTRAKAIARDLFGNRYAVSDIEVDEDELANINAVKAAGYGGTFPLTFSTAEGLLVTVNVTILEKVTPPVAGQAMIGANDFRYGLNETASTVFTSDLAKLRANVIAKDEDGVAISTSDITVDATELTAITMAITAKKTGQYPLTFTEPSGVKTTITVTIYGNSVIQAGKGEIHANHFTYDIVGGEITADKFKELAAAYAKDALGKEIPVSEIVVNAEQLATLNEAIKSGKLADYTVQLSTQSGLELDVVATLINSKKPDDDKKNDKNIVKTTTTKKVVRKSAKTGDVNNMGLYIAMLGMAMMSIIVVVGKRRKK
jgi:LPXTG-motif cell wall-anchored protein